MLIDNSGSSYSREGVAVTAAVDLFEVLVDPGYNPRVAGLLISQSSDVGDAAEEIIRYRFVYGNTTSGSGGASPDQWDTGHLTGNTRIDTVESFNTTAASGGSAASGPAHAFNIRAGEAMFYPPGLEPVLYEPSTTEVNVIRLMAAPADSLTMSATLFTYKEKL